MEDLHTTRTAAVLTVALDPNYVLEIISTAVTQVSQNPVSRLAPMEDGGSAKGNYQEEWLTCRGKEGAAGSRLDETNRTARVLVGRFVRIGMSCLVQGETDGTLR